MPSTAKLSAALTLDTSDFSAGLTTAKRQLSQTIRDMEKSSGMSIMDIRRGIRQEQIDKAASRGDLQSWESWRTPDSGGGRKWQQRDNGSAAWDKIGKSIEAARFSTEMFSKAVVGLTAAGTSAKVIYHAIRGDMDALEKAGRSLPIVGNQIVKPAQEWLKSLVDTSHSWVEVSAKQEAARKSANDYLLKITQIRSEAAKAASEYGKSVDRKILDRTQEVGLGAYTGETREKMEAELKYKRAIRAEEEQRAEAVAKIQANIDTLKGGPKTYDSEKAIEFAEKEKQRIIEASNRNIGNMNWAMGAEQAQIAEKYADEAAKAQRDAAMKAADEKLAIASKAADEEQRQLWELADLESQLKQKQLAANSRGLDAELEQIKNNYSKRIAMAEAAGNTEEANLYRQLQAMDEAEAKKRQQKDALAGIGASEINPAFTAFGAKVSTVGNPFGTSSSDPQQKQTDLLSQIAKNTGRAVARAG